MGKATLVVWFGEHGMQLFTVPGDRIRAYQAADGCFLNYTDQFGEANSDVKGDMVEHLAYMLGLEPYYDGPIPPLDTFLQGRKESTTSGIVVSEVERKTIALAPWARYEVKPGEPIHVDNFIRCGWLV